MAVTMFPTMGMNYRLMACVSGSTLAKSKGGVTVTNTFSASTPSPWYSSLYRLASVS